MKNWIVSVDQSTSATKVCLISRDMSVVRSVSVPHKQSYPKSGWAEHDANEIWTNVINGVRDVITNIPHSEIAAIAISNQRETTVIWDRDTGEPLCPAIVWQDVRAAELCASLSEHAEYVRNTTGLTLSPYYSAAKAAHALHNNNYFIGKKPCVGTVDSYLVFRFSGGKVFATDVTNAARTQLMNINTLEWDEKLIDIFGLKRDMLAESILMCDSVFCEWEGIPVAGVMGDSHAALFGNGCVENGLVKVSYGTGSSIMRNTGDAPVFSEGLSTCISYGMKGKIAYALEGNITCSGDTLIWLTNLGLFNSVDEIETYARQAGSANGVSLVPAFSGLGAPYFDNDARGILCGLTRGATKGNIAYAALEAVANQIADVLDAMGGVTSMRVDGGGMKDELLMQIQADYANCELECTAVKELSAMGAAYMASLAVNMYKDYSDIPRVSGRRYTPQLSDAEREIRRAIWKNAVEKAMSRR